MRNVLDNASETMIAGLLLIILRCLRMHQKQSETKIPWGYALNFHPCAVQYRSCIMCTQIINNRSKQIMCTRTFTPMDLMLSRQAHKNGYVYYSQVDFSAKAG